MKIRLFPKKLPDSLWKRIFIITVLVGFYGFVCLVIFIAGIIGLFQIPAVSGFAFRMMLTAGWQDFPLEKPPLLKTETIPAFTQSIEPHPEQPEDLFQWDKVWNTHLHFNSNQWSQLAPLKISAPASGISPQMTLRNPKASRAGLLGVLGWDLPWSKATAMHFNGQSFTNTAARYKGNGTFLESKSNYKRSFKLDLNEFVKGQKLAKQETINFHNLLADRSRMNDTLGYRYFQKIGIPSPGTTYVDLTLEIDGVLPPSSMGLYLVVEKPNGRWLQRHFGKKGGAVLKPVTLTLFKNLGDAWSDYAPIYGAKTELTEDQQQHLIKTAKWFTEANQDVLSRDLNQYFDLESVARFFAGQVVLSNYDGILFNGQNFLVTMAPETHLISFAPWDLDHSWGEFPLTGTLNDRIHASIDHPWIGENFFVEKLFQAESFRNLYLEAIRHQMENTFNEESLFSEIDHLGGILGPVVQKEPKRFFEAFTKSLTTEEQPNVEISNPMDPNRPVHQIKRFIQERKRSIESQLAGDEKGIVIKVEF